MSEPNYDHVSKSPLKSPKTNLPRVPAEAELAKHPVRTFGSSLRKVPRVGAPTLFTVAV